MADGWQRAPPIDPIFKEQLPERSLDEVEATLLNEWAVVISTGWTTFVDVGKALACYTHHKLVTLRKTTESLPKFE